MSVRPVSKARGISVNHGNDWCLSDAENVLGQWKDLARCKALNDEHEWICG